MDYGHYSTQKKFMYNGDEETEVELESLQETRVGGIE